MPTLAYIIYYNMKIRIGNDIRILAKVLNKNQFGDVNIHSVKAFVINKTKEAERIADKNSKTKFISRFPIEPIDNCYKPSPYNINCAGSYSYNVIPMTYVCGSYAGFGCNPDWNDIYKPVEQYNFNEFLAPTKATENRSVVEISFPAEAQLYTGDYKIILVAKLYQPGFSATNLRTITIDYDNVFTLVSTSEEGTDTPVTINVGDVDQMIKLKGDIDIMPNKTYSITVDTISDIENIRWYCKEPNVAFLEQDNNHLLYNVTELLDKDKGMEFEILALSNPGDRIVGRISIYCHVDSRVNDVYANSGDVNRLSGNIKVNLNNGDSFNINMAPDLLWYEGN